MTRCMNCKKEIPYAKYVMAGDYKWHIQCYLKFRKLIDRGSFEKKDNFIFRAINLKKITLG